MTPIFYTDSYFLINDIKKLIAKDIVETNDSIHIKSQQKEFLTYILDFLYNKWSYKFLSMVVSIDEKDFYILKYIINSTLVFKSIIVEIVIPKDDPVFTTVSMIYPVAVIFERELNKKYGIIFEGNVETKDLITKYLNSSGEKF